MLGEKDQIGVFGLQFGRVAVIGISFKVLTVDHIQDGVQHESFISQLPDLPCNRSFGLIKVRERRVRWSV